MDALTVVETIRGRGVVLAVDENDRIVVTNGTVEASEREFLREHRTEAISAVRGEWAPEEAVTKESPPVKEPPARNSSRLDELEMRVATLEDQLGLLLQKVAVQAPAAAPPPAPLASQKENYRTWFMQRSQYYHPSEAELVKMFSVLEEGDEIFPDYAHSFTIHRKSGLVQAVNRRGEVIAPPGYSPLRAD